MKNKRKIEAVDLKQWIPEKAQKRPFKKFETTIYVFSIVKLI